MAEASVALLITKMTAALGAEALRYAGSLMIEETSLLRQVHGKLREIATEFEVMLAFLRQLDVQGDETGVGNAWAEQMREAALEVEDIIDEYTYLLGSGDRRRFRDFLRKVVGRAPKVGSLPNIAQRLEDVDSKLQRLSSMKQRYGIKIVEGGAASSHDVDQRWTHVTEEYSSHLPDADGFVGMEKSKADLLGWLTDEESQSKLISVWGMGGLGKTTLVTRVFRSQAVKEHFHSQAWVTVSETYNVDDLLRKLLRECLGDDETMPDIDNMSHSSIMEKLNRHLQGKRYLLVLDDVWSTSVWRDVSNALTVSGNRSRIILTTRKHDVASVLGDHVMELQPLDENDAWDLFCKRAFRNEKDTTCPPQLEHLAKAILDKCQGLPLAIVALGSLLSLKDKEELEWRKVYDGLNWQLINNPQLLHLKNILFWSFKDLPDYLKHCFLYCCVFPEDYPFTRRRLIRLWVAEGLVISRGRLTMEEVAEDHLNELIYRGMLQVAERNEFGRVKSCRMHDMLREVALQMAEREKFCSVHDNTGDTLYTKARRLSIHKTPQAMELTTDWISRLRSFLLFDGSFPSVEGSFTFTTSLFSTLSSGFKLLRVLDLQGAPIDSIPEIVYHLFNLHYLSFRDTGIKEISGSLERLYNLETLDLSGTNVKKLPHGITKLKKLRHLLVGRDTFPITDAYGFISGVKPPEGLWDVKELQNMQRLEASDEFVRRVGNLIKLRSFCIIKVKATHCAELCMALSKMVQLQSLGIVASEKDGEMLDLNTMSSPPQSLQKLLLGGRLKNDALPNWFSTLRNLKKLYLHWSGLREDPALLLHESLPNLALLALIKAYEGRDVCFRAGCFPKLKTLLLLHMPVEQIEIEEGALARLEELLLGVCRQLKYVPSGIEHLADLRKLTLVEMAPELVERLRVDGDTRERVRSIQYIRHVYQVDGQLSVDDLTISS